MDDEAKPYLLTEAAEITGLSVDALRKRITRRKIKANRSNEDGLWRVWLAPFDIEAARAGRLDQQPGQASGQSSGQLAGQPDQTRIIKALEGEAAALREALDREQGRADRAEAERTAARTLADKLATDLADQRERVGRAEGEASALRLQVQAERDRAEAEAAKLRNELQSWTAGGALERALRALLWRRG